MRIRFPLPNFLEAHEASEGPALSFVILAWLIVLLFSMLTLREWMEYVETKNAELRQRMLPFAWVLTILVMLMILPASSILFRYLFQ